MIGVGTHAVSGNLRPPPGKSVSPGKSRFSPQASLVRLWLIGALVAVLGGLLSLAPPASAQGLNVPAYAEMNQIHLGFYLLWYESPGATGYDIQISSQSGNTWSQWSDVSFSGTTQPAIVTGLTNGTKYRWRIRATNGTMQSDWTTPDGGVDNTANARSLGAGQPNTPFLQSAVAGPENVTVTWKAGPERSGVTVTGFVVSYRWENAQGDLTTGSFGVDNASATNATVNMLTPGVEYELWVQALAGSTASITSNVVTATPQMASTPTDNPGRCNLPGFTPPSPPVITSSTPTQNRITLKWNSPTYGTTSSGGKDLVTNFELSVTGVGNSHSQTLYPAAESFEPATYEQAITGLSPATTYLVSLRARTLTSCYSGRSSVQVTTTTGSGHQGLQLGAIKFVEEPPPPEKKELEGQEQPQQEQGTLAEARKVPVPEPPAKPGAVQDVQAAIDGRRVTVTWSAPQEGGEPSQYVVRLKSPNKGKAKVKRVDADATSVTFGKVKAGTYTVYVRAKNDTGGGKWTKIEVAVPS